MINLKLIYGGTNAYGFGVDGGTLQYTSGSVHRFYTGTTNTLTIDSSGNLAINGSLSGGINVCKRSQFTFTPQAVLIGGLGLRYVFDINLNNYISKATNAGENQFAFRIFIWTSTGDFGDGSGVVENMHYVVQLSSYAGGKVRIQSIYNNSNGSAISYSNAYTILL